MKSTVLLVLGLGGSFYAHSALALASEEPPKQLRIYGGEPTETCEWPTTMGLGYCTGTLVHPRVLLTAAHCGSPKKVYLGEKYKGGIAKSVKTKYCEKNVRYSKHAGRGGDSQYCVLEESLDDIPIAPIAFGCELNQIKAGAKVWLVGFGKNDSSPKGSGVKHKVEVKINRVVGDHVELIVGGDGKATCYGDSGGPAYFKLSDGTWRTVGITSYGTHKKCGYPSGLTTASSAVQWIQASLDRRGEDIDLQPCYDDEGKWEPTAKCGGFALEPGKAFGSWDNLCSEKAPRSGMSSICGPEAEDGDFPKGNPRVKLGWDEDMPSSPSVDEGESLELQVYFKGAGSKIDHLAALLDDDIVVQGNPKSTLELDDLEAGEYSLKVQARGENGNVLAETKARTLKVYEAQESDAQETSPDANQVGSNNSSQKNDLSNDSSSQSSPGGDDNSQEDPPSGGCRLDAPAGSPLAGFCAALLLLCFRRRT